MDDRAGLRADRSGEIQSSGLDKDVVIQSMVEEVRAF